MSGFCVWCGASTANLHLVVRNNCSLEFLPSSASSTTPGALSLDEDTWTALSRKCNETWSDNVRELTTVVLMNAGQPKRAVDNLRNSNLSLKQHLKVVVLLGYSLDPDSKLAHFCSLLREADSEQQCFTDAYERMANFHHFDSVGVLSFWMHLAKSGFNIADDLLANANASKNLVIAKLTKEVQDGCWQPDQRCYNFINMDREVQKYSLSTILAEYYKQGYAFSSLINFVKNKLQGLACFSFNQVYQQMKLNNRLDTIDALELRVLSQAPQGSNPREDEILCAEVVQALLVHTPAHVKIFLDVFDRREIDKLRSNKLTVEVLAELVEARYGRGNKTKALIELFWRWDGPTEILCVGSLALVKNMKRFGHLATFEALSLFLHVNKHRSSYVDQFTWTKSCKHVQEYAPDLVKRFLYGDESCDLNTTSCQASAINYLESILGDNITNQIEEYPRGSIFVGYVLQSLKSENQSQDFQQQISTRETGFKKQYEAVIDALVSYYLLDDNATLFLDVALLEKWFNKNVYASVLFQVVRKAYARDGIAKMPTFMYQSEYVVDLALKCDTFKILHKEMEKSSQLESIPAFAL